MTEQMVIAIISLAVVALLTAGIWESAEQNRT